MSVRRSARLAVAIGITLVLAFGLFLFRQIVEVSNAVTSVLSVYGPAASEAAMLETAESDMQRGVGNYLLSQQPADLTPYEEGAARSELALQRLSVLLSDDEQSSDLLGRVGNDRQVWIDTVATPTIEAVAEGRLHDGLTVFQLPTADATFASLQSNTATLRSLIVERGQAAFHTLTGLSYRLIWAVLLTVALLGGSVMVWFLVAKRKVIEPLEELGGQIRSVARKGEHTRAIAPSGPAELRALGTDVEALRRHLVSEIDEARSARQALGQNAPVVAAIRAELSAGRAVDVPGLSIAGSLHPAEGVIAGDWWDSAVLATGEAAVVLADIAGHGAGAGVAAMQLKHAIQHDLLAGKDIGEMARSAADVFTSHPERFATVAAVCIHPATGHVRYINAGHHEPLVLDAAGRVVQSLARTGPILSWLGGNWEIGTLILLPGHTLLIYSDGLVESHDPSGEELGEERLQELLADMPDEQREPEQLVPWLLGAARHRAVDWDRDDVTVVAIRRADDPDHSVSARQSLLRDRVPIGKRRGAPQRPLDDGQ